MPGQKTDDKIPQSQSRPPGRQAPSSDNERARRGRPEPKSRDIDLERVLYDPEYRQAVQEVLSPGTPPRRRLRDVKPQNS